MYSELEGIMASGTVKYSQPMSQYTSFKIGGPVDALVEPESSDELLQVLQWCRHNNIPFLVFGAASNLLVRDKGIRGLGIRLGERFKQYQVEGETIFAQSGILLSELARIAAEHELTGMEFAEGIPGTLGGAVVMNAGAYDHEIKDILLEVNAVSQNGIMFTFHCSELKMSYRHSIFQENGLIVVSARLTLAHGIRENIAAKMQDLAQTRASKQPLDMPSAGSVFRRPEGHYVGPMLEKLGLKGYKIGDAQVSTKHAGFIVNAGNATADDVISLIKEIQARAKREYDVDLQTEIRIVGEE